MFPSFDKLTEAEFVQNSRLLSEFGYEDPGAAATRLASIRSASRSCEDSRSQRRSVPLWYKTLKRILREAPFPEQVLDTVDQFVRKSSRSATAFELFEQTPRSLEILARLACGSPFLTQCVLNQPDALRALAGERRTAEVKSRNAFHDEAIQAISECRTTDARLSELRRYQHREILRIGMCDAFGLLDLKFVTLQISLLADAMVQVCLQIVCDESSLPTPPFCVLALGKHGGEELNYSSDIDLVLIAQTAGSTAQKTARRLIESIGSRLPTGFLYRVDMRLRPWGDAGPLVTTTNAYKEYLQSDAALWEKQSLLKARVVAGDEAAGTEFLRSCRPLLFTETEDHIVHSIRSMKGSIEQRLQHKGRLESEVKLGAGSIRDIEFLTQALQLIHGRREERLLSANTLDSLIRLTEFGILDVAEYHRLREGYVFFRTIEHALQLLHNQQTHELPSDDKSCEWLARRLDFQNREQLLTRFHEHRRTVRQIFDSFFSEADSAPAQSMPANAGPLSVSGTSPTVLRRWLAERLPHHSDTLRRQAAETARQNDCFVTGEPSPDSSRQWILTVIAPDEPALLSVICGVFFTNRVDIREGVSAVGDGVSDIGLQIPEGVFVGFFLVQRTSGQDTGKSTQSLPDVSQRIQAEIDELLRARREHGDNLLREQLVSMFCRRLEDVPEADSAAPADISVTVSNEGSDSLTRLDVSGGDSFGFFFEVSNALAICGFRIRRTELGEHEGRIQDTIYVSEEAGGQVLAQERIEELRTAITLIKQFTTWIPSNSDPHRALIRFRDLLHQLLRSAEWKSSAETLRKPKVLRAVSRVLGMSRYLWEDFLQVQTKELLPLLGEPEKLERAVGASELSAECFDRLRDVSDNAAARQVLNSFKDFHLFRIDLRHVLGHCTPFGTFSTEITDLANVVVSAACRQAWKELTRVYGTPRLADGSECRFTLAALGKFGGAEMGFASDLEVFLVFDEECRTDTSKQLSAGSFFERLVSCIQDLIESRRRGIFEIDLRMRPYGQAGAAAVPLATFSRYYGKEGDAWPYERQSLVKLRCVGGSAEFASEVESLTRDLVYVDAAFDFDAMRALREKQIRQLVHGGTVNAKLSSGGLVDCEYAIQALQMTYGAQHPKLQTTHTMTALQQAAEAGLVTHDEYEAVRDAYQFLRQLIDCLRMVRGNAEDLTVPAQDSADFAQLVRRMRSVHESPIQPEELEQQMTIVRAFSNRVEQICS